MCSSLLCHSRYQACNAAAILARNDRECKVKFLGNGTSKALLSLLKAYSIRPAGAPVVTSACSALKEIYSEDAVGTCEALMKIIESCITPEGTFSNCTVVNVLCEMLAFLAGWDSRIRDAGWNSRGTVDEDGSDQKGVTTTRLINAGICSALASVLNTAAKGSLQDCCPIGAAACKTITQLAASSSDVRYSLVSAHIASALATILKAFGKRSAVLAFHACDAIVWMAAEDAEENIKAKLGGAGVCAGITEAIKAQAVLRDDNCARAADRACLAMFTLAHNCPSLGVLFGDADAYSVIVMQALKNETSRVTATRVCSVLPSKGIVDCLCTALDSSTSNLSLIEWWLRGLIAAEACASSDYGSVFSFFIW